MSSIYGVSVDEIIGLRFQQEYEVSKGRKPAEEEVCKQCCTEEEWKDFLKAGWEKEGSLDQEGLENAEAEVALAFTEDHLDEMEDVDFACDRCKRTFRQVIATQKEERRQVETKECMICDQPVHAEEDKRAINGAVAGKYIEIRGHAVCLGNVDKL